MTKEQIDLRIESKLIGKMANHRLMVRDLFRKRHRGAFPELNANQCMYHVNELRVWSRVAELIDEVKQSRKYDIPSIIPYETYYANELTKNK
ncbi:MAG: hypothetical protein CMP37_03780 [Rickettsiales bacterium]|nr:hypothetical protein [Rickettsiales bacterium]|tara:strand:+ start:44 stop:319 length:276 start_codon:yes stop_codon:yes gene_type:complete